MMRSAIFRKELRGFTLIELLVAMFLLAILGTAGFQMLFQITATRERIEETSDRLTSLQRTFYWMAEDVTQIIDRPIRSAVGSTLPAVQFNIQGENLFEFTRAGWSNPAGDVMPPRSNLQRKRIVWCVSTGTTWNRSTRRQHGVAKCSIRYWM